MKTTCKYSMFFYLFFRSLWQFLNFVFFPQKMDGWNFRKSHGSPSRHHPHRETRIWGVQSLGETDRCSMLPLKCRNRNALEYQSCACYVHLYMKWMKAIYMFSNWFSVFTHFSTKSVKCLEIFQTIFFSAAALNSSVTATVLGANSASTTWMVSRPYLCCEAGTLRWRARW